MRWPDNAGEQDAAMALRVFLGEPPAKPVRIQLWCELEDGTQTGRGRNPGRRPQREAEIPCTR